MVKIMEIDRAKYDPWEGCYVVGIRHKSLAVGYTPLLYTEADEPPEPPVGEPWEGYHVLYEPALWYFNPGIYSATRHFDLLRNTGPGEIPVDNIDAAWEFYKEMLGHPWRIISRCGTCFQEHRYLPI